MTSIELFAGAGGLALGASEAGFSHKAVIEIDRHSCENIRYNQNGGLDLVQGWNLLERDVRSINFEQWQGEIDLIAGGPPCQPFSIGGKHRGSMDDRNMFPHAIRAVRDIHPKAFIFENVKGLLRESFSSYLSYIHLQLQYPSIKPREGEQWMQHLERLEKKHTRGGSGTREYRVAYRLVNAADFGIPQRRERVFIVGFREDIQIPWSFPEASHSREALLAEKWSTGDYWERHGVSRREVNGIREQTNEFDLRDSTPPLVAVNPWRTVRDAFEGLGDPATCIGNISVPNHLRQEGARSYAGHTGSPLDEPAKTLKAGDHGVPGGENMLRNPDGSVPGTSRFGNPPDSKPSRTRIISEAPGRKT